MTRYIHPTRLLAKQLLQRNCESSLCNLSLSTLFTKSITNQNVPHLSLTLNRTPYQPLVFSRHFQTTNHHRKDKDESQKEEKVGIVKKFKQMSKDYWYVLIPVHVATSVVWYGGFYLMCKSGIDVGAIMQMFGASQEYIDKLSNSPSAHLALAYACYKIATPIRYFLKPWKFVVKMSIMIPFFFQIHRNSGRNGKFPRNEFMYYINTT